MDTSSLLLLAVLLTCSVCTAQGKHVVINNDTQDQNAEDVLMEAWKLPGVCKACKWILKHAKTLAVNNANVHKVLKSKLLSVCNHMEDWKPKCHDFVNAFFEFLIKKLMTADDQTIRSICVMVTACNPEELLESPYQQDYMSQNEDMVSGDNA